MSDFESIILPKHFKGKTTLPENRLTMNDWFKELRVSTNSKKIPMAQCHVFDVNFFTPKRRKKIVPNKVIRRLIKMI